MGFAEYNPSLASVPVRGPFGQALQEAIGEQQDAELALLREAMFCHLPDRCPDDGLDALGRHYQIERYAGESHASYRARLVAAWSTWETAGTAAAIEAQLLAFGYHATCYEAPDFRGSAGDAQHLFWVVLNTGGIVEIGPMELGSWVLGDGSTLGTTATAETIATIKRIVLKWKAAHAYPVDVIVLTDGDLPSHLGLGTTLGTWVLGAVFDEESSIRWPIGRLFGTTQTTLGSWVLGGYDI